MTVQGFYNDQLTLTVCATCIDSLYSGGIWKPFPSNWEPDNCTECGAEVGAL